jgi:soluble lytic murein transglycosylase-like protein
MRTLISFRLRLGVLAILAIAALPCFAGENAVLRNGFSIRHERREVVGDITRLYVTADGSSFVDVPTAEIEHFEAAPEIAASGSGLPASGVPSQSTPFDKLRAGFLAKDARNGAPGAAFGFASNPVNLNDVVNSASGRYRLDPDLVNSVIKAESGFNARAVSPKGAQGLMQLMPGTASQLGVPNAFDPQANVDGGTKYLRELLERYNFDLVKALAAYNAGPLRVEQYKGVPPYYETRAYVARIVRDYNNKMAAQQSVNAKAAPKSGVAKRPGAKTGNPASKAKPTSITQAKVSARQTTE